MSRYPQLTESVSHPLLEGITTRRLGRFLGGPFVGYNLSSALEHARVDEGQYVSMRYWSAPSGSKPDFADAVRSLEENSQPYTKGTKLGPSFTNHWIHVSLRIPSEFTSSSEPIIFEFDPGCEALIFDVDGEALHGITGGPNSSKDGVPGTQEDRRVEHVLPESVKQLGSYECFIEVSANSVFGEGSDGYRHHPPNMGKYYELITADLVLANSLGRALELDFQSLRQVSEDPIRSGIAQKALKACNDIMNRFTRWPGDDTDGALSRVLHECRSISQAVLGPLDAAGISKTTTHDPNCAPDAKIWAIGHCHIDTAWLWRYTQTQQKIARSWSSQCDLMDRYPNFSFAASSAQQYAWLKELYPKTFDRVSARVQEGRFVPVGGAWVEHDCMIPSGESMVRQYVYGQQYFQDNFGIRCREAWLPDTFGYASQLPQILRLCGIEYFFTQKLSWNNINSFPHSTFNWCGIDGSQVLAHMTPTDTYNAQCDYSEITKGVRNHKNLSVTDECLMLYGNGDGGGGPTPRMLEKLQRLSAAARQNPEVPAVKAGRPDEFFDMICAKTKQGSLLPTWRGELYFELHRGTYTSQARIKSGNRTMERLLRELEYFATIASIAYPENYQYPKKALDAIWKDVMLNQFHDVIPGTSIRMANEDAWAIYDARSTETEALIQQALTALLSPSDTENAQNEGQIYVIDPMRLNRRQVAQIPPSNAQGVSSYIWIETDESGLGQSITNPSSLTPPHVTVTGNQAVLENSDFRLEIKDGRLKSLVDLKLQRELISPGPGASDAGLMLYDDFPLAYDAWDAEIYHLDQCRPLSFTKVEIESQDRLRASVKATAQFGMSSISLIFSLDATSTESSIRSHIHVQVVADWHEKHRFLKFALPLDIHAPSATYGTQFGLVERATHRNTTHEQAKFEVCAHAIADLSEVGYGVAIASDHKYGYAVENNTMRISLLRSATAPDAEQDMGVHDFSFAIMPHLNRMQESGVYLEAMKYINPVRVFTGRSANPALKDIKWQTHNAPSVLIETIKRGEADIVSGRRTVVLRILETMGARVRGSIHISGIAIQALNWTNLVEEDLADARFVSESGSANGRTVQLEMRGFEIKTLQIVLE